MCRQWSGWEAYLAGLSASLRREYRRDTKRLRELGDVAFAVSTSDADIAAVLDWIIDKKVDWIVGSGAPADEFLGKRAYYHRFFAAMQRAGRLIVFELSVGGVPVAAQVALKWDDRLLLELSGWDYGWRAYSPGNVLAFEIIRWAFENDFGVVDLGMGGHAYKYHFTKSDEEVARHVLVASRPIGRLVVAAVNMRLRLRRKPAAKPLAGSRIREQALAWIAALCPVLQVVEPLLLV
jgi:CelD/BcsL family acetyltransferase involved in cellulose biosynthesis